MLIFFCFGTHAKKEPDWKVQRNARGLAVQRRLAKSSIRNPAKDTGRILLRDQNHRLLINGTDSPLVFMKTVVKFN